jgi:polar amino acid transport system permease protein
MQAYRQGQERAVKMQYSWDFLPVWRNANVLLDGVFGTLALTASALALALPLGGVLAAMRMASSRAMSSAAVVYIDLFRTAPALVLVVWFYFAFPILIGVNMDAYVAALLAIGLQSAAYMAEVFRGGMQSIGKGQWEAARAVGLNTIDTTRFVILPQAARRMAPVFLIRLAELVKATTLSGTIAYGETVYRASELSAQTYRPFEVFTTVAAIFFVIICGIGLTARWLERRFLQEKTAVQ